MTKASPEAALASHAGGKDTLKFSERIKSHGFTFAKGDVVQFEDPAVASYFDIAFNGTEFTTQKPDYTITKEELDFDPETEVNGTATIDPNTVIGTGREGVQPGLTVHQVASGDTKVKASEPTLEVNDVEVTSEG